jgi:Terminase large subunit, ATPase domain
MKRKPSIIEAIKNPKLFGSLPRFKNLATWTSWLVVLKAIFGLPMTAADVAIFIRHTGRITPPEGGSKETYLVIGRRGGKSFISALITCFIACFLDFKPFITVGETLVVMCLARDKEQARIVFRYVKAILNHVSALRSMIVDQRTDEIELTTGVTIMVKASDFGGVRGPTIACVVADEIAFWPSQGANPDDEVLSAIRPAMATIPDAKLLCISTGYAQVGALYDAHKEHYGKDDDVLVWQSDTASMNPTISQTFIDKEIEKDPEAGRAEWLGLFREDVSAAFSLELIEACTIPGRLELPPSPHVLQYFGFVDPSGGRHDAFTLAIAHLDHEDRVILDAIRAARPPFDPAEVVKEYSQISKAYGLASVIGDNYGGEWPKAEFAKHGITYELSEKTKSELYLATIPVFTSRRIELLDIEKMKTEFRRLERRRGRSGKDSIDHPPRGSDDIANAVSGVICLAFEHAGQFVMPEAYGEITCSDLTFYMEGLAQGPMRDRYW